MFSVRSVAGLVLLITLLCSPGFAAGRLQAPFGLESTKSTTCPKLGSDAEGELVTVV